MCLAAGLIGDRWADDVLQHGDIDILKDLARSDAENAVERFDQVVALAATVLASEMVGEAETGAELLGFDQEPSAIRLPFR